VSNPINERRNVIIRKDINHLGCNIQRVLRPRMYYGSGFYLQNQKTSLTDVNWCELGVSMVRITTECAPPGSHRMSSNESKPVLFPWFEQGVHPTQRNPVCTTCLYQSTPPQKAGIVPFTANTTGQYDTWKSQ